MSEATPISKIAARDLVTVAGKVERLRIRPQKGAPAIEATIADGTGRCTAVWMGRRSIKGLTLGSRMIIEGRVALKDNCYQILNPTFELVRGDN
ncbi:MAG: OB-fold nucleic acid binding domain-containing protein [Actinomycetota bacterium]